MSAEDTSAQPASLWRKMHSLNDSNASLTSAGSDGNSANGRRDSAAVV